MYTLCLFLFIALPSEASSFMGKQDTSRITHLVEIAKQKQKERHPDSAEYYFKQAGELADQLNAESGKLLFAGNYSAFLYDQVRFEEAMEYAQLALTISLRLNNRSKAAAAYNNIALQHQAKGQLKEAANNLIRALEISNEIKHPTHKDLSDRRKYLNNLSSLLLDLQDLDKGLEYAWQSYEIARQLKDTISMGNSLVNVMVAEAMAGKLVDAVHHGKQYLSIGRSYGDLQMEIKALNNLAEVYRMQQHYPLALETFAKALAITPKSMPGNEVYTLSGMSRIFKEIGNAQAAKEYFEMALKLATTELATPQLVDLYKDGADINEALGDYKQALDFHKKHAQLKDSLQSQETQKTIQELEVRYETAQNRKQIVERDLKIVEQAVELDRQNKWFIIFIFSIFLLVFGLVAIRLLNRQKRKAQSTELQKKLIEAQLAGEERERERTAKELHDGVASILSAASLQINAMTKHSDPRTTFQEVSQLIEIAVREIRNISHNLAPEMILEEGLGYAIQSFCQRVNKPDFQMHCYVIGELPELDKGSQLTIYRVIQECVTNILKHAQATEGIVQLSEEQGRLLITVEDNGIGFDTETLWANGIGFHNLNNRVQSLQGNIDIRSCIGKGTSVFIEIDCPMTACLDKATVDL
ncbi:tetratricopeptide repeat protein [Sphingobacterium sp. SGR-19]|uniref:ATP-binding protein n=1 Tax=Sphingobacterium sp. SGR-19 TaxID=2710886 RepID=UPI0013ECFD77|nr:tetratricopeptide repeat protein [Sphingobacterium sp. SGR-19]NGM64474.1 tetratricopeptide repeat protein [Sphingobacterium sp. SGR-19]